MNDLKMLDELGAALDPPIVEPPARLRGRVLRDMSRPPRRFRMPVPRFGWRLAATGGLAVALAAGLITAQTLSVGDHEPAVNAEAAEILQRAALVAEKQPDVVPKANQYVFVETETAYSTEVISTDRKVTVHRFIPGIRQVWLSVDGTEDGLVRTRPESDPNGWEEIALPGCKDGKQTDPAPGENGKIGTQPCEPTPAYLDDLPTNTDAMYDYLYKNSHGGNPPNVQAFITVGDLTRENYVPSRSLAAMFNAAAKIPGATVQRDVVDIAGRHGISVGQTHNGVRSELIFDPQTYAYLGERTVAVKDLDHWKKGDVTGGAARLRIAIVDKVGRLP